MPKTIRFGDLVRSSGRPEVVTLWAAPEKDARVSSAMKENRVLTVFEEPGKKAHGMLGLHPGPHSMFLIFPRTLTLEPQTRVVGVNYALAEQPQMKDPVVLPEPRDKPTRSAKHKRLVDVKPEPRAETKPEPPSSPPKPVKRTFAVHVRRTATIEESRNVEAENRAEAERLAAEEARAEEFDLKKADVRVEVIIRNLNGSDNADKEK